MAVTATQLNELYLAYFGRPADFNGLNFYLNQANATLDSVAAAFSASPESQALYGTSFGAAQVNAIYQNLFNRDAEVAGLTYWSNEVNSGRLTAAKAAWAILVGAQNADKTTVTNKLAINQAFTNALDTAAEIVGYNGTAAAASARAFIATVTTDASLTTATAGLAAAVTAAVAAGTASGGGGVTVGQTFTMTSGVDLLTGGSGNDTFIADNTLAGKQLSTADQLNGGAGTDTLKVFLAAGDTATGQPTLTSIEEVYINGGAITAYTAAAGTTKLSIDAPVVNTAATYTINGQTVSLANHNVTANTTTTVVQASTATATSQTITLNGVTKTGAAVAHTLDVSGAKIATLNLETTGASSTITLANTGAGIRTLNVSGDKALALTEDAATAAAITTVSASAATGNVSVNTAAGTVASTFKFTGGAGNDTLTFKDDGLAGLISGAQLDGGAGTDKIGIFDTVLSAPEAARINQAVSFETLGLNAAITLDASTLTSIKSFSVDTTALTQTINSLATGSTVTVTAAAPTSLTLGTNVGVTDVGIVLGSATSSGITVGTLVTTGITNVTLTSNGTAANAVTTLTNSDNSVFTVKGAADLTLALAAGTAVGSKVDASAATGKMTLTGSAIATSGDIIIGGSANDTINGGKGADTLTGNGGVDTFSFTASVAANASGGTFGQADVVTDFVAGTDKLQFAGVTDVVSTQQGAVQAAVTALAAGSSATAIATAMATANTTNLGVSFAVFEGNTYVLYETAGGSTGVAADDVFVKLVGVTTLPTFAVDVVA